VVPSSVVPVAVALIVLGADAWVFIDAKGHADRGTPVTFRAGSIVLETPAAWLAGCLLLWLIFFPLYLSSRT
jgi:hypothetical protein